MTRRILIALLTFTILLVGGAGATLAVVTTSHDRAAFTKETSQTAQIYATVYDRALSDEGGSSLQTLKIFDDIWTAGNGLLIQALGDPLPKLDVHMPAVEWQTLASKAESQSYGNASAHDATSGPWMIVAYPLYQTEGLDAGAVTGAIVLVVPLAQLNSEVRTLWLILGAISLAAMLAAALIAVWLARWVSRPLAGLDTAAHLLADGDLSVRARDNYGPPELRRTSRTFNTMAGRLETLVHGSRAALADVSHQLRTPLRSPPARPSAVSRWPSPTTGRACDRRTASEPSCASPAPAPEPAPASAAPASAWPSCTASSPPTAALPS